MNQVLQPLKNTCEEAYLNFLVGLQICEFLWYFSRVLIKLLVTFYIVSVIVTTQHLFSEWHLL